MGQVMQYLASSIPGDFEGQLNTQLEEYHGELLNTWDAQEGGQKIALLSIPQERIEDVKGFLPGQVEVFSTEDTARNVAEKWAKGDTP